MAVKARRKAVVVDVGGVKVGGDHPIVVQSMTNTDTVDVAGTVNQAMALARAVSDKELSHEMLKTVAELLKNPASEHSGG